MSELRKKVIKHNQSNGRSLRPSSVEKNEDKALCQSVTEKVVISPENFNADSVFEKKAEDVLFSYADYFESAKAKKRVLTKIKAAEEAESLKKSQSETINKRDKQFELTYNTDMTVEQFNEAFDVKIDKKPVSKNGKLSGKLAFAFATMCITLTSGLTLLGLNIFPNLSSIAVVGIALGIAVSMFTAIYICEKKGYTKVTDLLAIAMIAIFGFAIVDVVWKFGMLMFPSLTYLGASLVTIAVAVIFIAAEAAIKSAHK